MAPYHSELINVPVGHTIISGLLKQNGKSYIAICGKSNMVQYQKGMSLLSVMVTQCFVSYQI